MAPYEFRIGLHYLRARKESGFLSVIAWITVGGILVGVMALVVTLSFASGFERALRDKIIGINAHLLVLRFDGELEGWRDVSERLHGIPGVATTMPLTYHKALLRSEENVQGVVVRGVWEDSVPEITGGELLFRCGGLSLPQTDPGSGTEGRNEKSPVWIGSALADTLEVDCGGRVHMVALAGEEGGKLAPPVTTSTQPSRRGSRSVGITSGTSPGTRSG